MNSQFHLLPRFWQWLWKVLQILCSPIGDKQSLHIIPGQQKLFWFITTTPWPQGVEKEGKREQWAVGRVVFGSLRCRRAAVWSHKLGEPSAARGGHSQGSQEALLAFSSPASLLITSFIHSSQQKYFQRNNGRITGQREASESRNTSCPAEDWRFTADRALWGSGLPAWPACAY